MTQIPIAILALWSFYMTYLVATQDEKPMSTAYRATLTVVWLLAGIVATAATFS